MLPMKAVEPKEEAITLTQTRFPTHTTIGVKERRVSTVFDRSLAVFSGLWDRCKRTYFSAQNIQGELRRVQTRIAGCRQA